MSDLYIYAPGQDNTSEDAKYLSAKDMKDHRRGVDENGEVWVVPLGTIDPKFYAGFDVYPAVINGEGGRPNVDTLSFDGTSFSGDALPIQAPEPSRYVSFNELADRFDTDLAAVYTAAKADVNVEIFLDRARKASPGINLDDPRTITAVNQLESSGILGVGRAAVILA